MAENSLYQSHKLIAQVKPGSSGDVSSDVLIKNVKVDHPSMSALLRIGEELCAHYKKSEAFRSEFRSILRTIYALFLVTGKTWVEPWSLASVLFVLQIRKYERTMAEGDIVSDDLKINYNLLLYVQKLLKIFACEHELYLDFRSAGQKRKVKGRKKK